MPFPAASTVVHDLLSRPLGQLRVSVTDRCNLRCQYCMPEMRYHWLPRANLLTYEETARLTGIFTGLGVNKVRLTGGEPLLRRDIDRLVGLLAANERITELALTTNGILLPQSAEALARAGLSRITISLDTLDANRFRALTRQDLHARVIEGIRAVKPAGFQSLKLDTVLIHGFNDDELFDMIEFARSVEAEIRFIEYMDVGGATLWSARQVVSRKDILERIEGRYGSVEPVTRDPAAPAERFALPDGLTFGIIASVTEPFCGTCNRSRLTADGMWYLCLYAAQGMDLRTLLRSAASDEEIAERIANVWAKRADRGAEERKQARSRGPLIPPETLQHDPHLEMHTRGG